MPYTQIQGSINGTSDTIVAWLHSWYEHVNDS